MFGCQVVDLWGENSGMLENSSLISQFIFSMFSSSLFPVGSLDGGGGLGSVRIKDEVQLATNLAVMSGFLTNVDVITPKDLSFWGNRLGCEGAGFHDPPVSNRGILVVIFCTEVSNSGSFLTYAWKSLSWSNLSLRVSGIAFLHMSTELIEGRSRSVSYVNLVGDGVGL